MNSKSTSTEFCELSAELLKESMVKIRHCLCQLSEEQFWWRPNPALNSVGNLCLHLAGNLRQWGVVPFIGVTDERNRESEFCSDFRAPRDEMIRLLEVTVIQAKKSWIGLSQERLQQRVNIQGFDVTLMQAISHTSSHFVGHTHQIIMLTRMQLGDDYRFQWSPDNSDGNVPI